MNFVWLNKQGVASDQGFVLERVDRFAFEYREGNRTMRLEGESIVGGALGDAKFGFVFYSSCHEGVSKVERERIMANIKAAMAFMGGHSDFD